VATYKDSFVFTAAARAGITHVPVVKVEFKCVNVTTGVHLEATGNYLKVIVNNPSSTTAIDLDFVDVPDRALVCKRVYDEIVEGVTKWHAGDAGA